MAMTRRQWSNLQQMLPQEDRMSYEDYLATTGESAQAPSATPRANQGPGLTGAEERMFGITDAAIAPTPITTPVITPKQPLEPTPKGDTWTGTGTTGDPLALNGSPYTGQYNGATYVNGILKVDSASNQPTSYAGNGNAQSPLTANGIPYTGTLYGATYVNGVIQLPKPVDNTKELENRQRRTAQQEFKATLGEIGLADLADTVDAMIIEDKTIAQIKMDLPNTKSYKDRFPGMEALRKAGVAINEATYISNERGYLQTLRAFGLDTSILGSRQMLGKYIENTVAPREFEERVSTAANRLDENPEVMETFKTFYPEVDKSAVLTYILNPTVGIDVIRKQVRTAEIGAAATKAGLAGVARALPGADELARSLIGAVGESSYNQISASFQRAKQLADTQRRLAAIEGQNYQDVEAVQAVVGGDIQAGLASQRRTARELARFQERGGVTATSLQQTNI
jgi:hypothetical protein